LLSDQHVDHAALLHKIKAFPALYRLNEL